MREHDLAYCGLDCSTCPVLVATVTDDEDLRRETAERWSAQYGTFMADKLGRSWFTPEDMRCRGCKGPPEDLFVGCRACHLRGCARERGVESCASCGVFEGCDAIAGFCADRLDAGAALRAIRAERPGLLPP